MKMFYEGSQVLWESLYTDYTKYPKQLLGRLSEDTTLSRFDAFIKRFDISCGLQIEFTDERNMKRSEATRDCYRLMLKISDLWFAFEHLLKVVDDVLQRKGDAKKPNVERIIDPYDAITQQEIGFPAITNCCNELLTAHVFHEKRSRYEMYSSLLPYLKNNTRGLTKDTIAMVHGLIKDRKHLEAKHILALACGLRNIYVHEGVSAALGGKNYAAKRELYKVIHDALTLYSVSLATHYAQEKLAT